MTVLTFISVQGQKFQKIGVDTNSILPEYNVRKVQTFYYNSDSINYTTLKNDISTFFDPHYESLKEEKIC